MNYKSNKPSNSTQRVSKAVSAYYIDDISLETRVNTINTFLSDIQASVNTFGLTKTENILVTMTNKQVSSRKFAEEFGER